MGITCRENLLRRVPALIEAIKVAGLVLVSDASAVEDLGYDKLAPSTERLSEENKALGIREGIDGTLTNDGILNFQELVDL